VVAVAATNLQQAGDAVGQGDALERLHRAGDRFEWRHRVGSSLVGFSMVVGGRPEGMLVRGSGGGVVLKEGSVEAVRGRTRGLSTRWLWKRCSSLRTAQVDDCLGVHEGISVERLQLVAGLGGSSGKWHSGAEHEVERRLSGAGARRGKRAICFDDVV
jgi:hypothetical protein